MKAVVAAPVRLGLIGLGRWGQVYAQTIAGLSDRCRLTHVGTSKPEHAARLPYPVQVLGDWRRVIESECDAVIIATPPATHAQIVEACLDAGKPCVVEKPFCTDLETARRLHEKAAARGSLILVDHTLLFHPAYQALKRRLQESGEPIRAILADRVGTDAPHPELPVVWEWGPHDVSLCLDLLGQRPHHVDALAGDTSGSPALAMLRLDFPDGVSACIRLGWRSPDRRRMVSVVTDRHQYVLDDLAAEPLTVAALTQPAAAGPVPISDHRSSLEAMMTYFLEGLSGRDRRYFGTAAALQVTRVLAACEKCLTLRQSEVSDTSERGV